MDLPLKQLSRLCAVCGVFPYLSPFDPIQEKRTLFLRRPIFWWWLLVLAMQIIQALGMVKVISDGLNAQMFETATTLAKAAGFYCYSIFFLILNFIPRTLLPQLKELSMFVKKLNHFDLTYVKFERDHQHVAKDEQALKRFKHGLIFGSVWVIVYMGLGVPFFMNVWMEATTSYIIAGIYIMFIQLISFLQNHAIHAIVDLGCAAIARRLDLLGTTYRRVIGPAELNSNEAETNEYPGEEMIFKLVRVEYKTRDDVIHNLENLKQCLRDLSEAFDHINASYSLSGLICLTCKLFMCSISIYNVIYTVYVWPPVGAISMICFSLALLITDFLTFIIILTTAEKPVKAKRKLLRTATETSTLGMQQDERIEVLMFQEQVRTSNFSISAGGMFNVGMDLLPGISASILTYIIVLLQSSLSGEVKPNCCDPKQVSTA